MCTQSVIDKIIVIVYHRSRYQNLTEHLIIDKVTMKNTNDDGKDDNSENNSGPSEYRLMWINSELIVVSYVFHTIITSYNVRNY